MGGAKPMMTNYYASNTGEANQNQHTR